MGEIISLGERELPALRGTSDCGGVTNRQGYTPEAEHVFYSLGVIIPMAPGTVHSCDLCTIQTL